MSSLPHPLLFVPLLGLAAEPGLSTSKPLASRCVEARCRPFRPLTQRELFENQVRFHDGLPAVHIGLAEDILASTWSSSGLTAIYFENEVPVRHVVPAGASIKLTAQVTAPARYRWRIRGKKGASETLGALFAMGKTVLDTRATAKFRGRFASRAQAEKQKRVGEIIEPVLEAPARGFLDIEVDGERLGRTTGVVALVPIEKAGTLTFNERVLAGPIYAVVGPTEGHTIVNTVDIETMLQGVVPAEIFSTAPPAALEAQSLVARGAVVTMLGHRHLADPFHVCDKQHCQVYAGQQVSMASTNQAVAQTRGQVIGRPKRRDGPSDSSFAFLPKRRDGPSDSSFAVLSEGTGGLQIVESVYSATCGGHTEANDVVWAQPAKPSLRPRLDGPPSDPALSAFAGGIGAHNIEAWVSSTPPTYCARATLLRRDHFRWTKTLELEALQAAAEQLKVGPLRAVEVLDRGLGGKVLGLRVTGTQGAVTLERELQVRQIFGGLRSGTFVVFGQKGQDGILKTLTFQGAGYGHGVGLCQMGAIGRAEAGQSASDIISFYYSGARVFQIYR